MINLQEIREAAELSRAQLAENLGLTHSGGTVVGQRERRKIWLMSTVIGHIDAAGATAELVVQVEGQRLSFDCHNIVLREIREVSGKTQREIADAMGLSTHGVTRSDRDHITDSIGRLAIAKLEGRSDWLISSLITYINATGAEATLKVYVGDKDLEFKL